MKAKLCFLFIAVLSFPVISFANDFSVFGSWENRRAFVGKNKITIAENIPGENSHIKTPLEMDLDDSHYFKIGGGARWKQFDVGVYHARFFTDQYLRNKFANTLPLSAGLNFFSESKDGLSGSGLTFDPLADPFDASHITGIAINKFNFKHTDIEVGARFKIGDLGVRFSFGGRQANYTQSLGVERKGFRDCREKRVSLGNSHYGMERKCPDPYVVIEGEPTTDQFPNGGYENTRQLDMDLSLFGPKMGVSIDVQLTKKLSFIGGVNWAVLFGERDTKDNFKSKYFSRTMTEGIARVYDRAFDPGIWHEQPDGTVKCDPCQTLYKKGTPAVPAYENEPFVELFDEEGFVEKDRNTTVYNLELEVGLQYDLNISDIYTLSFLAGYRYDIHFGVRTTCGVSKIVENRGFGDVQDTYGNCGVKSIDEHGSLEGSMPHLRNEDFISHGPFIKTSITF